MMLKIAPLWFCLLPIHPPLFAVGIALIGLYALLRGWCKPIAVYSFVIFAVLGAASQIYSPKAFSNLPSWLEIAVAPEGTNLIPFNGLAEIRAWNPDQLEVNRAVQQGNGFWRVNRLDPVEQKPFRAILSGRKYPVTQGKTYTQSVYFRSDGEASFDFYFTTARGQSPVPAKYQKITTNIVRAYASYSVLDGDIWIRPMELGGFGGNWSYIELAYPQLELGDEPTAYSFRDPMQLVGSRVSWWLGTGLLGFLVLTGCVALLQKLNLFNTAAAVLFGLAVQLLAAVYQSTTGNFFIDSRVAGLAVQPNFLGHQSVVQGALVGLLGGSAMGFYGLTMAFVLIGLSQSRAAFAGFGLALIGWWCTLPQSGRWAFMVLAILTGAVLAVLNLPLGRLVNFFSDPSRLEIWSVAWTAFSQNPLVGLGLGGFEVFYYHHLSASTVDRLATHAHHLFLGLLAETGLVGFLAFVQLILVIVIKLLQARQWTSLTVLLMVFIINLFDATFFYAGVHYAFWLAVAAGLVQSSKAGDT